jgi:hypothetical protein
MRPEKETEVLEAHLTQRNFLGDRKRNGSEAALNKIS